MVMYVYLDLLRGRNAKMGRPLRDRSNFWTEEGMWILKKAATDVLRVLDPAAMNPNSPTRRIVELDDLINEVWLRSFRRGDQKTLGKQFLWSKHHVWRAWRELRFEQSHTQGRPTQVRFSTDFPLVCDHGDWGTRCLDLWDYIGTKTTCQQRVAIANRAAGYLDTDTACDEQVTSQAIAHRVSVARHAMKEIEPSPCSDEYVDRKRRDRIHRYYRSYSKRKEG